MSGQSKWSLFSIFDYIVPTMHMSEIEIYVIWVLGEEGPKSIYSIAHKARELPEIHPFFSDMDWKKRFRKKQRYERYDYHPVYDTVKKLKLRGLVQDQGLQNEEREAVGLTFLGIMFYLQHLEDTEKGIGERINHTLKHYSNLIPFSTEWRSLTEHLGDRKCKKALEDTIKEFRLHKARFNVRSLNLKFDSYAKRFLRNEVTSNVEYERDKKASDFLGTGEANILMHSYIAYLALEDLGLLSGKTIKDMREMHETLKSEEELAYFEKRKTDHNSLFCGERLKEFLPEYSSMEHFFTGMFVESLIKTKKRLKTKETETPDFEVEYY